MILEEQDLKTTINNLKVISANLTKEIVAISGKGIDNTNLLKASHLIDGFVAIVKTTNEEV